uniref:Peroxin-13 n=1 Tax=Ananas comosus var. bracteatus TaxID=296719 RepID=A0A6V7QFE0_ANACO|nr:unnamed protein product [Ananas comosus var. bracteatus]
MSLFFFLKSHLFNVVLLIGAIAFLLERRNEAKKGVFFVASPPRSSAMASNSPPPGNTRPIKPWDRPGTSSGPTPFKPPSNGSTSDVVEASGTAKPGEIVNTAERNVPANTNTLARPVPRGLGSKTDLEVMV